ncbi:MULTISPECIES: hypothetical protein [Agrobacterium]|uniref:Uncharacterized protein n=1 Tax=Agrobacterium tumefaciens TaxID=358 RepID=A0AAW8M2M0_AGRTU|nr:MULTISPECIES: hypothetical protein [Agrobacterium]MBP2568481.1 hypothetical protein [Agrobacterium tumefaciens]MDR6705383.1 hypothetical protein [Agrobacterium tumefaciens]TCV45258.1 hypothetical protein EDB97_12115 [Agrobacterium tumefaciens]
MSDLLIHVKSPAVRAGLIIPAAIMMIMFGVSILPFWSGTAAVLINTLALTAGLLGGLFHILEIMPPALASEEIEWRKQHPDEYGEADWEAVPFLHNILVRIRRWKTTTD